MLFFPLKPLFWHIFERFQDILWCLGFSFSGSLTADFCHCTYWEITQRIFVDISQWQLSVWQVWSLLRSFIRPGNSWAHTLRWKSATRPSQTWPRASTSTRTGALISTSSWRLSAWFTSQLTARSQKTLFNAKAQSMHVYNVFCQQIRELHNQLKTQINKYHKFNPFQILVSRLLMCCAKKRTFFLRAGINTGDLTVWGDIICNRCLISLTSNQPCESST